LVYPNFAFVSSRGLELEAPSSYKGLNLSHNYVSK
jgi:hypothetical protein